MGARGGASSRPGHFAKVSSPSPKTSARIAGRCWGTTRPAPPRERGVARGGGVVGTGVGRRGGLKGEGRWPEARRRGGGTVPGVAVVAGTVFLLHDGRHTVGELRPVGVQPAAPAGGEAGEEPRLLLAGPVAGALLLAGFAAARLLQPDVLHQVSAERGAPGLLDVQEDDHVAPLDVEIHEAGQVLRGEVEARHEPGQGAVLGGLGVRFLFLLLRLLLLVLGFPRLLVLVLRRRGPPRSLGRPPGWRGQLGPPLPVLGRRLCPAGWTRGGRLAGFSGAGLLPEVGAGAGAGGGHVLVHDDHEEESEHRRQQPLVEPFIHGPALRPAGYAATAAETRTRGSSEVSGTPGRGSEPAAPPCP